MDAQVIKRRDLLATVEPLGGHRYQLELVRRA